MSEDTDSTFRASGVQGAAAVIKGLRLLQVIPELGAEASPKNIQHRLGLPRPTVYRLLNTLEQEGFIERNPLGGEYVLGRQLIHLAQQSLSRSSLRERVRGVMQRVSSETGETVHLGVPYGCHMTFIDKVESVEAVRMASYIGMPVPMHSTSVGKAWLAALDDEACEQYLQQLKLESVTAKTITDLDALRQELALTRQRGYSLDDEENELGIICFGHAVLGVDGRAAGAISVSVPRYRLSDELAEHIVRTIRRHLERLD
ncbi:IclR family transcriptional regulator [Halomonas cupida]|uniref:HTH-type transcriptional repressor AllR n=1 Tax=Halomonas cupida TaxID=44933 RepID=A0A1M7MKT1_9GAMM|nr:IclR family transcriptional regulator [Halomonas cupida]GEN26135.1 IclR family transcriptional regulator [Halomonas cupida]SHM91472.1 transcriptional regulator, IclR family [Halomonas cupida]